MRAAALTKLALRRATSTVRLRLGMLRSAKRA